MPYFLAVAVTLCVSSKGLLHFEQGMVLQELGLQKKCSGVDAAHKPRAAPGPAVDHILVGLAMLEEAEAAALAEALGFGTLPCLQQTLDAAMGQPVGSGAAVWQPLGFAAALGPADALQEQELEFVAGMARPLGSALAEALGLATVALAESLAAAVAWAAAHLCSLFAPATCSLSPSHLTLSFSALKKSCQPGGPAP